MCILGMICLLSPLNPVHASPLLGIWIEDNGPGAARIAPCTEAPQRLCATGYDRLPNGKIGRKGAVVLRDLQPDGKNRWRGTYLDGDRKLPATVRLVANGKVTMRVCLLVLCQTATYARIGD
jgi:uncharacterized protein (DUF2147 family)